MSLSLHGTLLCNLFISMLKYLFLFSSFFSSTMLKLLITAFLNFFFFISQPSSSNSLHLQIIIIASIYSGSFLESFTVLSVSIIHQFCINFLAYMKIVFGFIYLFYILCIYLFIYLFIFVGESRIPPSVTERSDRHKTISAISIFFVI